MNNLKIAVSFLEDVDFVMQQMIEMDGQIGDVWKWPDSKSCLLYALTESAEYIEAYLLNTRPGDSRNNKKPEDFDVATELFDITMMLFRAWLKSSRYSSLQETHKLAMQYLTEYIQKNLSGMGDIENAQKLAKSVEYPSLVISQAMQTPQSVADYTGSIGNLLLHIYLSREFSKKSYREVATAKLDKILAKNLEKKRVKQYEEQTNSNPG